MAAIPRARIGGWNSRGRRVGRSVPGPAPPRGITTKITKGVTTKRTKDTKKKFVVGVVVEDRLVLGFDLFLYADLTARENLEFFGRLAGVAGVEARVALALNQARLTDRAADRVGGFSRGLRQRLALERALLHAPRLVLLDEPFTG